MYNKGRQILHPAEASRLLKWCQQFSDSEAALPDKPARLPYRNCCEELCLQGGPIMTVGKSIPSTKPATPSKWLDCCTSRRMMENDNIVQVADPAQTSPE